MVSSNTIFMASNSSCRSSFRLDTLWYFCTET
jgi:hypothetical protein